MAGRTRWRPPGSTAYRSCSRCPAGTCSRSTTRRSRADPPVRLLDVRHEQTAVFAAEATARLTRTPGLAVVTAGPGVTNSVSAVTTAWFNGAPVVVLGGRAPDYRWGAGSLQEMDHPPLLAPVTKRAWTEHRRRAWPVRWTRRSGWRRAPHRGPVFLDISLEALYGQAEADLPPGPADRPLPAVGARRRGRRPDRRAARGRPGGRCWCWAPTCGWAAPRTRPGRRRRRCGCR